LTRNTDSIGNNREMQVHNVAAEAVGSVSARVTIRVNPNANCDSTQDVLRMQPSDSDVSALRLPVSA